MNKVLLSVFFGACLLATSVLTASAAKDPGISKKEIKIGSSCALGGHASFLGTQLTQGAKVLIDKVNADGGIHGRKITIVSLDDKYNPVETEKNTKQLIEDEKVFALFNYVGTPTSKVILRTVNENKIPVLGLFTGAEFLRNPFQPYIYNVRASYFKEAETIVDYWVKKGNNKIAVFLQDDAFGYAVLEGVRLALARHGLSTTATAKFKRGQMPTSDTIAKIAKTAPDGIIMVGTYTPLAQFVKSVKAKGLDNTEFHTVSFVGSGAFARQLLSHGGETYKNVIVTQVVPSPFNTKNATVQEFVKLYKQQYPNEEPNYVAMEGFINAKILIKALQQSGKRLSRIKFMKTLESMDDYDAGTGLSSAISSNNHQ
jgi:branched-chain amino acid transport system substrate-binding protein